MKLFCFILFTQSFPNGVVLGCDWEKKDCLEVGYLLYSDGVSFAFECEESEF